MSEFDRARFNSSNKADIVKYHVIPEMSTCRVADGYQFSTWNTKRNLTVHRSRSLYVRLDSNKYFSIFSHAAQTHRS